MFHSRDVKYLREDVRVNAKIFLDLCKEAGLNVLITETVRDKAYQEYCKDYIIELLNNDGIPGFYYEPKTEKQGVKFSPSEFKSGIKDYISDLIGDRYEFRIPMDEEITIVEQYKDKFIKDATGRFNVKLLSEDVTFTVLGEIKSGQLCRPKRIEYNGEEYAFNITSINKIVKMS